MSDLLSMFFCCARSNSANRELMIWQRRRNKQIERDLRKEKDRLRRRQMILLLGTGESGKSTFLKQMRIINGKRFSSLELEHFKDVIYDNIYKGVLFLLQARESLGIPWESVDQSQVISCAQMMEENFRETRAVRRERARLNQLLWKEDEFLALIPAMSSENTRYYLNRLNYIGVKNYCPTDEDIVWSRKPTESIIEEEFIVHNTSLVFIDVGGQTKERRKWCQCFSDMTSVLFLIACSHYDERYQDRVTKEFRNKLREAMIVFEGLINHVAFRRVSIIIFFNKTDILKEKVAARLSNIRDEFPNYPAKFDPFKLQDLQIFIVEAFASLVNHSLGDAPQQQQQAVHLAGRGSLSGPSISGTSKDATSLVRRTSAPGYANPAHTTSAAASMPVRKRMLYRHFTTAVDSRNIETVFHAMQDTVLQNNLRRIMMS
ncbi:hypothetical protein P879_08747 [Paragonimus westermani]|uniref:Guanine nucleotide-binding protein subunit alpha-13 n=1 Tax=Paragonimus westermani TaxID=34504 RepID=A0A8T0D144_9TREM|nr:hypothetical protein P879_08747 [Paragonimus westermani]